MIALIDADSMVYRVAIKAEAASESEALKAMAEYIEGVIYDDLAFCEGYEGFLTQGKCFRYQLAKTQPYKGNRIDLQKPKHHALLFEYLATVWDFKICTDIEADDALGIRQQEIGEDKCLLVHIDKDLDQYSGKHYNFAKKYQYYVSPLEGDLHLFKQCLMGDTSDHIKGLHGIGPKKAWAALKECETRQQMFNRCVEFWAEHEKCAIEEAVLRCNENLSLLYLQRSPNDIWKPMEVKDAN